MRLARSNRGMTAIEALISILVLSIVGTSLLSLSVQCLRGWGKGAGDELANSYVTLAAQKLSFEIRQARLATVNPSHQLVVTFPMTLTDPNTGEKIYDPVANDPVTSIYYVSNGNLVRSRNGIVTTLARGISSRSVFSASDTAVDITLISDQQLGTQVCTQQATAHVALRNYH